MGQKSKVFGKTIGLKEKGGFSTIMEISSKEMYTYLRKVEKESINGIQKMEKSNIRESSKKIALKGLL